jgi:hypothetical protein
VGSDDGLIHVSKDGGANWENVTPANMPEWSMVNSIEPSAFDEGTCYVAATRYKLGDFQPYLYKTTDYGKNWQRITSGIANEHFTRVVREDPKRKGLLYAGTETGMYISFNDGRSWKPFQLNLPIVPVTDLAIKDNNLIVATQGRSLWIIDDLTVLHQVKEENTGHEAVLYRPKDAYRTKGGISRTPSKTEGQNHPNGVITHFYLKDFNEKDSVALTYTTTAGDTLSNFTTYAKENDKKLKVKTGGNSHVWDTRGKGAQDFKGMILWWASLDGAKAVPGSYKVHLTVNGKTQTQPFTILPDPRAEVTVAQMKEQYDFISDINNTVDKAHGSIKKIRDIKEQLEAFMTQYKGDKTTEDLVERAKKMKSEFEAVEKALYQTQNRSGQDPLNFPIKLTNKLAHLNSLVSIDDFHPTAQDIAVKNELTSQIEEQLRQFDTLVSKEIQEFNEAFNSMKLDYLFIEE